MKSGIARRWCFLLLLGACPSCTTSQPPPPPVTLPRGGMAEWNMRTFTYWDRNGDGKPDRLRHYWGSGYAREYFDDDFDGAWDSVEHVPGYQYGTGLKENMIPEGLSEMDRANIAMALKHCIPVFS